MAARQPGSESRQTFFSFFFLFFLPFGLLCLFVRTLCWQGCISLPLPFFSVICCWRSHQTHVIPHPPTVTPILLSIWFLPPELLSDRLLSNVYTVGAVGAGVRSTLKVEVLALLYQLIRVEKCFGLKV